MCEVRSIWKTSATSALFHCEPKTSLKNKDNFFKKLIHLAAEK